LASLPTMCLLLGLEGWLSFVWIGQAAFSLYHCRLWRSWEVVVISSFCGLLSFGGEVIPGSHSALTGRLPPLLCFFFCFSLFSFDSVPVYFSFLAAPEMMKVTACCWGSSFFWFAGGDREDSDVNVGFLGLLFAFVSVFVVCTIFFVSVFWVSYFYSLVFSPFSPPRGCLLPSFYKARGRSAL
jgi:hypothetical protein